MNTKEKYIKINRKMHYVTTEQCRICLKSHALADIFTDSTGVTIAEKIMYCTSVQVMPDDILPSKICKRCIFYLNVAYIFRIVCERTDAQLKFNLSTPTADDASNAFDNLLYSEEYSEHPIETLLKQENLQNSKLFGLTSNELLEWQENQSDDDLIHTETSLKLNSNASKTEKEKFICEDNIKEAGVITSFNRANNLIADKNDFTIEHEILLNEETLLAYEKVCLIEQDFLIEDNCLSTEGTLISEINELQHEKSRDCKPDEINNELIATTRSTFKDSNEPNNFIADDGLLLECKSHHNISDKPIYSQVCLNSKDPLLLNSSTKLMLTDCETSSKNSEMNENPPAFNNFETIKKKAIDLRNIPLHNFEHFENELNMSEKQSTDETVQTADEKSNKNTNTKSDNRVGRHIAKKNAGQPPKRYSPTLQNLKENTSNAAIKDTKLDEIDENVRAKTEVGSFNNIFDQEYIFENDLSMPEPIFEETIVTDSFYFSNDDEELSVDNIHSNKINIAVSCDKETIEDGKTYKKRKIKKKRHRSKMKRTNKYCLISEIKHNRKLQQNGLTDKSKKNYINKIYDSDEDVYSDLADYSDNHYANVQKSNKSSKNKQKSSNTTCRLCNKSFPFPSHLQRHLTAHIGIKRFSCKYCGKQFLHSYNLSVHMRSHTGNFPLHCNICNRGFASPSVLERHKRSHTGETPFQCQFCLQLFTHASSLSMHEKMHLHRPSFPCDICFKVFSYKSSLTAHKKAHLGFKQHTCNVCHKMFTRRTSVLRHMLCHTDVKRFKCRTCGETVSSKSSLVKHRRTHAST